MRIAWRIELVHPARVDNIGISEFIAGVLAASFITIVGTTCIEQLRWRREDKIRFDQQKLQAYTRFLGLVELERQTQNRACEEDVELRRSFTHAKAELMVLASPKVRKAASEILC